MKVLRVYIATGTILTGAALYATSEVETQAAGAFEPKVRSRNFRLKSRSNSLLSIRHAREKA